MCQKYFLQTLLLNKSEQLTSIEVYPSEDLKMYRHTSCVSQEMVAENSLNWIFSFCMNGYHRICLIDHYAVNLFKDITDPERCLDCDFVLCFFI